jgi:phosphate transport system substrate-binding protein
MNQVSSRRSLLLSTAVGALLSSTAAMAATPLGGGSTLAAPTYEAEFPIDHGVGYSGAGPSYTYCAVGSGAGHSAFLTNSVTPLNTTPNQCYPNFTAVSGPVLYGAADSTLATSDVTTFQSAFGQPLIQIPIMGTPITLPFNLSGVTTNGGINLTSQDVCGIMSGKITDWSGITSHGTLSGAISVAYRSDGSGTSFLFTNRLKVTCNSINSKFTTKQLALMPTQTFASLFGNGNPALPANFHAETGSGGVETFIVGTSNAFGYLSPDYTQISTHGQGINGPFVASYNGVLPTALNTNKALGTAPPPSGTAVSDPTAWVPLIPRPTTGYQIVGWTTWDMATCYATTAEANAVIGFVNDHLNGSGTLNNRLFPKIAAGGFVAVSGSFQSKVPTVGSMAAAIVNNFLTNTSGNNLNINGSVCSGAGVQPRG